MNPVPDSSRVQHPVDVTLLAPLKIQAGTEGSGKALTAAEVSWMRNSSYITRRNNAARKKELAEAEK